MDEVTQQNSALVEENAATARTLEQQSKTMDERVAAFRIGNAGHATSAVVAKRAVAASPKAAAVAAKSQSTTAPKRAVAAPRRAAANGGGPVGRMHASIASAINDDDWKEF